MQSIVLQANIVLVDSFQDGAMYSDCNLFDALIVRLYYIFCWNVYTLEVQVHVLHLYVKVKNCIEHKKIVW